MGVLSISPQLPSTEVGFVGVKPCIRRIYTDDTLAAVTAPGYLNPYQASYQFETYEMVLIYTSDQGDLWANISITDDIISLVPDAGNGNVVGLPVTIDDIATFANTDGALKDGSIIARAVGFVQSGTNDSEGGFIALSGEGAVGAVIYGARPNADTTTVRVANDYHNDSTTVHIPESGVGLSRFILSDSQDTQYINTGNLEITEGNLTVTGGDVVLVDGELQCGFVVLHSNDGTIVMYPGSYDFGRFILSPNNNVDNTVDVVLSHHSHAASTAVLIPDSGQLTSNFILSESPGDQFINSGGLSVNGGQISTGSASGTQGAIYIYSTTALSGYFRLLCADATGNKHTTLQSCPNVSQSATYTLGDAGSVNQSVLVSSATNVGNSAAIVSKDLSIPYSDLSAAGVYDVTSDAGYRIRALQLNIGGTNFSGGGGNRNIQITDGTTVYSVIPAATAQSLVNAVWGATALPLPVSASINTQTVAALQISYSGGTTDYTAGNLHISLLLEKVA